ESVSLQSGSLPGIMEMVKNSVVRAHSCISQLHPNGPCEPDKCYHSWKLNNLVLLLQPDHSQDSATITYLQFGPKYTLSCLWEKGKVAGSFILPKAFLPTQTVYKSVLSILEGKWKCEDGKAFGGSGGSSRSVLILKQLPEEKTPATVEPGSRRI
ncbi:hypothetical protein MG293_009402, partial [Ovis ammon polii]